MTTKFAANLRLIVIVYCALCALQFAAHAAVTEVPATGTGGGGGITLTQGTNIANSLKTISGIYIAGDSLSTELASPTATTSITGQGGEWPGMLLTNRTWRWHLPEYNEAYGGATAQNLAATDYNSAIHPNAIVFLPWTYVCSVEIGINDVGGARTLTQVTNDLATIWALARADKMVVAAWTLPWATNLTAGQAVIWTNVNNALPAMSALYDYLVTMPAVTNAAVQLIDNVHPTILQNVQLAAAFANTVQPVASTTWTNVFAGQASFDTLTVGAMVNAAALRVTTLGTIATGAGLELAYDNTSGNSGGNIIAYDRTHATYRDLALNGANVNILARSGTVNFQGQIKGDASLMTNLPVALSLSGTNVNINAASGTIFPLILTTNALFTVTGGSDGQQITLRLTQGGLGNCQAFFTNLFFFGSDITAVTLTTNLGKTDYVRAQYWAASNRWDVLAFVRGY